MIWRDIEVNPLVESFSDRVRACQALDGACLNGHRNVVRGFQHGIEEGEAAAEDVRRNNDQVLQFKDQSTTMFEWWEQFSREERLTRSINTVKLLRDSVKSAASMPRGFLLKQKLRR
jgi:hypothetical protein